MTKPERLQIKQFPCLSDNYCVLLHDPATGQTAAVDAPEAAAIRRVLAQTGWTLSHIFITHHHHDHTGGLAELKRETACHVVGPRLEAARIGLIDQPVGDGDNFAFAGHQVEVIETPGHTAGHVSYHIPGQALAFVGDTMFVLGCGRLFEGSAETMWQSLSKLAALAPETEIYCGHEYTEANARFALTIEPGNTALVARAVEIAQLRAAGQPTVPTRLDRELATNPFLRSGSAEIRQRLNLQQAADWQVFAEIRKRKDAS